MPDVFKIPGLTVAGDQSVTITGLPPGFTLQTLIAALVGERLQNEFADPGDGGAIPVDQAGVCAITTAAAETRTLAAPSAPGQQITLVLDVDGGDCVITVAHAISGTDNTITLNDAGDSIVLYAISFGGADYWRVLVNNGATLSTV